MAKKIITDFTGGEVSDRFMARVDSALYQKTCQTLENFIPHASGGADFRPGTYYYGAAETNTGTVRLIPFVRSATEAYVLELSDYLIRIWHDGELVQSAGANLEITSVWAEADLFELKYAQTDDAIYFTHPEYQLQKLKHGAADAWSLVDAAFSLYLAVGGSGSPYINSYSYSDDIFEKKADPATLPTGTAYRPSFSPGGLYLAVPHDTSPYITIYKRSGDVLAKLDNPGTLPNSTGFGSSWSPDAVYLVVTHELTPFITIYKRSGDTFTKLTDPGTLPAGLSSRSAWSPDGVYLAVAHHNSPYVTIYKRSGDTFTKLTDPTDLPAGVGRDCSFSSDGVYLAVAHTGSPYVTIYKRSGDTFTKLSNPDTLPTGDAYGCSISPNGRHLAVAHNVSPYVTIYKQTGDIFTKLDNPGTLPAGNAKGATFSFDSKYMAVGHSTSPYVTIYEIDVDTFTKLTNPATLPAGTCEGVTFVDDGWIGIPWGINYPTALTFHEQRLIVGRGKEIWASCVGYVQDFRQDASDDSYGYEYEFASDVLEKIQWMTTAQHNIIIGTQYGEWLMTGGGSPITASNVYIERVSAYGSANIAALLANESVLFVQKGGQRLREFMYSNERGGFISPDLTLLADHIGVEGFVEMEWQRSPRSILWTVKDDGELASLTLDRNHQIASWSRHPMDGTVESVAVIPGTNEDIVYMVVKREIDGSDAKYIEYLKPINRPDDEEDYFFADCGLTFDYTDTTGSVEGASQAEPVVIDMTGHPFSNDDYVRISGVVGMTELNGNVYQVKNSDTDDFELYEDDGVTPLDGAAFTAYTSGGTVEKVAKALSGLDHLEGESVQVYADGEELGDETVSSGAITIDDYAAKIHVGLPYTGTLLTQRLGNFSSVRIPEGTLLLYKTRGGKIGPNADYLELINYSTDELTTAPQEVRIGGRFSREGSIMIVQDQPYPMTILGLVADMVVED